MQEIIKNTWQHLQKNAKAKLTLIMLVIALIGLPVVDDYGITVDEGTEIAMVRRNLEWVANGTPIPGDLKYFGTAFNVLSETIFQAKEFVANGFSFKSLDYAKQLNSEASRLQALKDRVIVKHYVTFIFSGITYLAVAEIVSIFCGREYAWLGALSLAVMPIHWGHGFFNPKDTPFAAMFTLSSLMGAYLINYYLGNNQHSSNQDDRGHSSHPKPTDHPDYLTPPTPLGNLNHQKIKLGNNQATAYTIFYGILLGLSSGVRIGAFLLLLFFLITYLILWWERGRDQNSLINFTGLYLALGGTWAVVHAICYPGFWGNPIAGFFETLNYLSNHSLKITVLFKGWNFPIQKISRWYLPTWIFMSIPVIFNLGFIVGSTWIIARYRQLSILQKSCAMLLWWQILLLPLFAVVRRTPVYDGMRHFLFITPGLVAFTVVAIVWLYKELNKFSNKNYQRFLVGLVIATYLGIAIEMVSLHPYQYVYVNRLAGGIQATPDQFDLEILGLSLREGMEWLNENGTSSSKVVIGGLPNSAKLYAAPRFEFVSVEDKQASFNRPFYYLSWLRWGQQYEFSECPIVHQVTRQGVSFAVIRECK
ncbi:MAG: hypothetical protein HC916_16440 [Coleofasciculaceae cyanobacterium SM2_1_6]|nr:hypothetical protein [Coleofasciculaceae cyanobacterium SM2_1_6]